LIDLSSAVYLSPEEFKHAAYKGEVKTPAFTVENVAAAIRNKVEELKAKRIVIDSITALMIHTTDQATRRRNMAHLFRALLETGCTCLVTSEINVARLEHEFQLEEYLAQGVILLQALVKGNAFTRIIQVEKMRGTNHDTQPRPYNLTDEGLIVFSKEIAL